MAVVQGVVPVLLLVVRVVTMVMLLLAAMDVSCTSHVLVLHDTVSTRVEPSPSTSCLLLLVMMVVHLIVPRVVLLVVRMVRVVAVARRSSSGCRRCVVRVVLLLVVQGVAPMRCRCKASTVTEPMGACNTRVAVVVVLPALMGVVTAAVGTIRCVALIGTPGCCSSSLVCPPLVAAVHLPSRATVPQRCMVLRIVLLLLVVPIAAVQGGVAAVSCSRCRGSIVTIRTHVLLLLRALLLMKVKVTAAAPAAVAGGRSCRNRRSSCRASCTTSAVGCRQLLVLDPTTAACKVVVLLLPLVVAAVEAAPDLDRELCCCCEFILACHVVILRCQRCCCCMVLVPRELRAERCDGRKVRQAVPGAAAAASSEPACRTAVRHV
jgi:hypothetical protein